MHWVGVPVGRVRAALHVAARRSLPAGRLALQDLHRKLHSTQVQGKRGISENIPTDSFIRIVFYPYIMPKQKITISLDSGIAKQLRIDSIEKYGDARSLSRFIEDLATGAAEAKQPETCSLGARSKASVLWEAEFKEGVKATIAQFNMIKLPSDYCTGAAKFFMLKEACELGLNGLADIVNGCWTCEGLNGRVPKYPDAGRNFEIYAVLNNNLR